MPKGSTAIVVETAGPALQTVTIEAGGPPTTVSCELDSGGQHTLRWPEKITLTIVESFSDTNAQEETFMSLDRDGDGVISREEFMAGPTKGKRPPGSPPVAARQGGTRRKEVTLRPGSCNLYRFPHVNFNHMRAGVAKIMSGDRLIILEKLLFALLTQVQGQAAQRDAVGACPIHALLVANTEPSVLFGLALIRHDPTVLLLLHEGAEPAKPSPFQGEGSLHIFAVNRKEDELVKVIDLACRSLDAQQLERLFLTQAGGVFFSGEPMLYYGSTPINYMVAFALPNALYALMRNAVNVPAMKPLLDFKDTRHACNTTGFYPLHVARADRLDLHDRLHLLGFLASRLLRSVERQPGQ